MKDMNRVKVTVIGVIAALAVNFMGVDKVQAQEFKIQGDLVSSYVWRGFYQTGVSFTLMFRNVLNEKCSGSYGLMSFTNPYRQVPIQIFPASS